MENRKRRILWESEASFLATGFSSYGLEILKRLYDTGKFEIFEMGSYARPDHPHQLQIPWKFYGTLPTNQQEEQAYNSKITNQFGEWKLEQVLLDCQPDIVCSSRDHWMTEYVERCIFRPNFKWVYMTCVDSIPLKPEWIQTYVNADAVLSYTQWGLDVCDSQSFGQSKSINYVGAGADNSLFTPAKDKRAHKASCGIDPDMKIIVSVMRNQKRKLFPDLIYAFSEFLKRAPKELASRTFLYLHTSYPDIGSNFVRLLQEYKVSSKVLFTYCCRSCRMVYPSFFRDGLTICPRCGQNASTMSNTTNGINRESMPAIYNLGDIYTQSSICEALGIPVLEAASCGLPIIAPDYAGTKELVDKLNGFPIPIKKYFHEFETGCIRTYPDNDALINIWIDLLSKPSYELSQIGMKTRELSIEHYSYDRAAKIWDDTLSNIPIHDPKDTWLSKIKLHNPVLSMNPNVSNADFVRWCIANVWGRPELVISNTANEIIKSLNYGCVTDGPERGRTVNRDMVFQKMIELNQQRNFWEHQRYTRLVNPIHQDAINPIYV